MLDVIGVGLFCGLMLGVVASPLIIMGWFSSRSEDRV